MPSSTTSQFVASRVSLDADWNELMHVFWASWKAPLQASGELTFPHLGTDTAEERQAFRTTKESLFKEAVAQQDTVIWLKCCDTKTGKIVGGICYKHEKDWPSQEANFTGCGFQPGTERQELSDSFYRQLLGWRKHCMKGEHICESKQPWDTLKDHIC